MNYEILASKGIDTNEVKSTFSNLKEYEESLCFYLNDDFFSDLEGFIKNEDYAMTKDAVKGLLILAQELKIFSLYHALAEVYEDLLYENYKDLNYHVAYVLKLHSELRGVVGC